MTPAARHAAAAGLLDDIAAGRPAEQVLTNWARANRYAGSGDRAAVRDIVFDGVRRWRSSAARGGGETGRARVLGLLREAEREVDAIFSGERYALDPLSEAERFGGRIPEGTEALDVQDWLVPHLRESLGGEFVPVCEAFRHRATVFLRWNAQRTDADTAISALAEDGIAAVPHDLAPWALEVVSGARRIRQSRAYSDGVVEIQDAASQAVCAALPSRKGLRVLDYCAGGGGKALALAAMGAEVFAHDGIPARMSDLPARAERSGVVIQTLAADEVGAHAPFDLVLADVPCSGSGAWRRQPEAKWSLTPERLEDLTGLQAEIMDAAAENVSEGGQLAYATCSVLAAENADQVAEFLQRRGADPGHGWGVRDNHAISPLQGGDGFFLALLDRTHQP